PTTFWFAESPANDTSYMSLAAAHGHVANEIIALDLPAVKAFLGRIQDPPSAKTMPIDDSAFRAIMFTDMVGSTEMTAQLGDTIAVELLRAHDAIIRRCLEHHRGSEVKHLATALWRRLSMHRLRSRVQLGFSRNSHHVTKSARPRSV